ncbi:MAG: hypothetical protein WCY84_03485, partial [Candidatus Cloacimonadaceae bacterium]
MKKYLFITLVLLMIASLGADIQISTRELSARWPFDIWFGYTRCASIYLASEIGASGTITHLGWDVRDPNTANIPIKIYITTTDATTLQESTWEDMKGGLVPVFDGIARFDNTDWHQIDITDFYYDAATSRNLLVLTEANYGTGVEPYPSFWGSWLQGQDINQTWTADGAPPTGMGWVYGARPDIRFYGISGALPPEPVTLIAPADGATDLSIITNLSWTDNAGTPTGYDLYFGEDYPVEGNPLLSHEEFATSHYYPGLLNYGTTYYWKVVPWNDQGHPEFELCETRSFTTMNDTSQPMPYFQDFEGKTSLVQMDWSGTMQVGSGYGVNDSYGLYRNL